MPRTPGPSDLPWPRQERPTSSPPQQSASTRRTTAAVRSPMLGTPLHAARASCAKLLSMTSKLTSVLLLTFAYVTLPYAAAAEPAASASSAPVQSGTAKADPRVEIASRIPGAKAEELRATPISNLYELTRGSEIAYVTTDGKYAISGDLIDIAKNDDLTESHRRELRVQQIGAISESDMVIFSPKEPKYTVTVFTDVDCAYCRELHRQVAEYNRLGIRIRYIFYPRTGPNTESWTKAEEVWCSPNRNDALTRAKLGQPLSTKPCASNPVARTYAMGQSFGLQGTPAIVLADGSMIGGYMPPEQLFQELKKTQRQ
jgi:thiol:disulfide interchange protein DsbC